MAKYDFKCSICGGMQEIEKPMGSDWVPVCCGQSMSQIYNATPTIFKTGGFYSTGGQCYILSVAAFGEALQCWENYISEMQKSPRNQIALEAGVLLFKRY